MRVVASLPCYSDENVDQQRGSGVFQRSIAGLRLLNDAGYGQLGSDLQLDLVYNPNGAFLAPPQANLQVGKESCLLMLVEQYKRVLGGLLQPGMHFVI